MHILKRLPRVDQGKIPLQPFPSDSRELFDGVLKAVKSKFKATQAAAIKVWEDWDTDVIPSSDSAEDYVKR
jgi:hypothetical protein